jgi:hypothetical protein
VLARHHASAGRYHLQFWSRRDEWTCAGVMDLTVAEWLLLAGVLQNHDIEIHNERAPVET